MRIKNQTVIESKVSEQTVRLSLHGHPAVPGGPGDVRKNEFTREGLKRAIDEIVRLGRAELQQDDTTITAGCRISYGPVSGAWPADLRRQAKRLFWDAVVTDICRHTQTLDQARSRHQDMEPELNDIDPPQ